jgi:hypothetical protein
VSPLIRRGNDAGSSRPRCKVAEPWRSTATCDSACMRCDAMRCGRTIGRAAFDPTAVGRVSVRQRRVPRAPRRRAYRRFANSHHGRMGGRGACDDYARVTTSAVVVGGCATSCVGAPWARRSAEPRSRPWKPESVRRFRWRGRRGSSASWTREPHQSTVSERSGRNTARFPHWRPSRDPPGLSASRTLSPERADRRHGSPWREPGAPLRPSPSGR